MTMLGATRVRRPTLAPVPFAEGPFALPLPFTPLADGAPPSPGGRKSSYWPSTREDR